uniref:Uncharacterized protein n=1 Tax=Anguilla anguilla TaxID=7936 RepID=A0A0E9TEW9_ANGAN
MFRVKFLRNGSAFRLWPASLSFKSEHTNAKTKGLQGGKKKKRIKN